MADTLDWLTLAEGRAAVNADPASTSLDVRLAAQITAIARIGDDLVGPVVRRTVTAETHDGGTVSIRLRRAPVYAITSVREVRYAGQIDTITESVWGSNTDGWYARKSIRNPSLFTGELLRKSSGVETYWPVGVQSVEVTYTGGRYASTSVVDERFKEASRAALRRLWKRESGAWTQSADFFAQQVEQADTLGVGFFDAVVPVLRQMLADEVQQIPGMA